MCAAESKATVSSMAQIRTITHSSSGASCTVSDFGATVLSFKTGSGQDCLFVSRDAKLDGSKAVRGGIPLVFPQFGQPDKSMPQHGFLRNNFWMVDEASAYDNEDSAGISYTIGLVDAKNSRGGKWDKETDLDCSCVYSIKIEAEKMTTTIEIKNTSEKSFDFQTLQHTYYMVDNHSALDSSQCFVKGLAGYSVIDKVTGAKYVLGGDPVSIDGSVDRIYNPPSGKDVVDVVIGIGSGKTMKMTAIGSLDGSPVPVSCVVWNPYKENAAKMSDFGDDQVNSSIRL